jgi:predicted acetyltransferase
LTVTVSRAPRSRRLTVWRLLQLYLSEMSAFNGRQLDSRGVFAYPHFPRYWNEDGRYAFLTDVGDALAGFALARRLDGGAHEIAEFFFVGAHRGGGVGRAAAVAVLDALRFHHDNAPAAALWTAVTEASPGVVRRADDHQLALSFSW